MFRWDIFGITWQIGGAQALAAGLVFALTLLNCAGLAIVARVQNVLTSIKVVVIAAFVLLGFVRGPGKLGQLRCRGRANIDISAAAAVRGQPVLCDVRL